MADSRTKRKAVPLPTGAVSVWNLLSSAINATAQDRPANSVIATEYAERAHVSYSHAVCVLRARADLRPIHYRSGGRRALCYVPRVAE